MTVSYRHVGIDEAGYGPNLGPLVMTSVSAEGPDERTPDLWADLPETIARAGSNDGRLWVDDSKQVYKPGSGCERLNQACAALLDALGQPHPTTLGGLIQQLGGGTLETAELATWIKGDPAWLAPAPVRNPFLGASWRILAVKIVVMGPLRFNRLIAQGGSKADAHFDAFQTLLREVWEQTTDERASYVVGDKHGGRHFYLDRLCQALPDTWIDRGREGPALSEYTVRQGDRRLSLSLRPKADAENGLVALASLVSKAVREAWMEAFNAFWIGLIPGLRPTAGYPVDARRFRAEIEAICRDRGWPLESWWRMR